MTGRLGAVIHITRGQQQNRAFGTREAREQVSLILFRKRGVRESPNGILQFQTRRLELRAGDLYAKGTAQPHDRTRDRPRARDTRGRVSVPQSGDPRHRAGSSHARVCAHPGRPSKCQLQTDLLEHEARPFPELNSTVGGQQRAGSGGPWLPGAHCALRAGALRVCAPRPLPLGAPRP